ncbi:class I SAM-dependent methyltransferase [Zavarzinia aquatilis]|uniref:SAM-dependent methyltransferase n=1 Tax=Zavarzinia aquatilis TaxID=2211142 RepID=A0A317E2E1_9PROT|nr:class I SAM-dependent methyltransferase [Zavarzinia aquatilis]PWR20330.1 SAM-dependent methyltransferase [Zavarzinia aquatilis]
MSLYERHVVPRLINFACGLGPFTHQRRKVVPQAKGVVLEIGIGTGHNLPHYDAAKVERLIGLDPSEESWKIAGRKASKLGFPVEFIGLPGERIPLPDASVDTVVVTYSLCTIPDPVAALQGMRRVLKPEGELLFCEHGEAPDVRVLRWQDRVNPVWKRCFGGCNLHRPIPDLLKAGGFAVRRLESMYLPGTPKIAAFNYWGSAIPA